MRKFFVVLGFELKNYLKDKTFLIITLLISVFGGLALFLPSFFDLSDVLPVPAHEGKQQISEEQEKEKEEEVSIKYYISDDEKLIPKELWIEFYEEGTYQFVTKDKVEQAVKKHESDEAIGFVVNSLTDVDYYVINKGMMDMDTVTMQGLLATAYQMDFCEQNHIDYATFTQVLEPPIKINENILGKDTESNFWYCYAFEILIFMMIVMYGQMIAVAVTSEKSNRSIEVLVTSTTPVSLLFGKVIAGAIAAVIQVGAIFLCVFGSYAINRDAWGGLLDMILHVPAGVMITFCFFGLGGFLFYAFLYGAMGALVSKTEDISKSVSGIMMVIMVVYFISLAQLSNVDGILIKVLSFLPFSSYSAMFARIAMGSVSIIEVIVSGVILVASIVGAGWVGAFIYRRGTLRYGNPIKLKNIWKE